MNIEDNQLESSGKRKTAISTLLQKAHNQLISNYKEGLGEKDAEYLENFLNEISERPPKSKLNNSDSLNESIKKDANNTAINEIRKVLAKIVSNKFGDFLFGEVYYDSDTETNSTPGINSSATGMLFEEDLTRILAAIEIVVSDIDISTLDEEKISKLMSKYSAGSITSHQKIDGVLSEILIGNVEQVSEAVKIEYSKEAEALLNRIKSNYYFTSQKPDVRGDKGPLSISIDKIFGLLPPFQNIIRILSQAKISAKSYSGNGITLGMSNNIRAVSSALMGLGFPSIQSFRIAFALQDKFKKTKSDTNFKYLSHMQHLKFAYELAGLGMITEEEESAEANLLVIADRQSRHIYVRSVSALISQFAEETSPSKKIKIRISGEYSTGAKKRIDLKQFWSVKYNFKMS